eukprot:31511-Eustigmatos_ZCMA.PRE.1
MRATGCHLGGASKHAFLITDDSQQSVWVPVCQPDCELMRKIRAWNQSNCGDCSDCHQLQGKWSFATSVAGAHPD